jgi:hypothetical protein
MDIAEEFLSHAAECKRMAQSARDTADKATWDKMAEKCLAYAQHYGRKSAHSSARKGSTNHRTRLPALNED